MVDERSGVIYYTDRKTYERLMREQRDLQVFNGDLEDLERLYGPRASRRY